MLRKLLIVLVGVSLTAGIAAAQTMPAFGVKGGVNLSNVNLDDLDSSNRTGFVGGLFVNLWYPGLNVQGEILYTTKGYADGKPLSTATEEYDFSVHAIEVPILAKFRLPVPAIAPSIYAGPAVSFTMKAEYEDENGETFDVKDETENVSWSLIVGVDVTIAERLIVDLRYDIGMSALNKAVVDDLIDIDDDLKDRTFSAMAGFVF
ncbi:MAG TPA: porin family protein [Candidatus Krumholzibacteria bacterium]|nr:porin family protein [Candidatus Krumholzibacteria bacterium]HPD71926.1 porin family protein [Candidatus Krumholzibacteria bacterium]HRY41141.1 porin family protein [Candidatus Krumholzibacteria bacterium]